MRILTLVKQVPDSTAVIKVRPDGSGIETASLKLVLNPFDEFAVELALRLREGRQDVEEIAVLSLGPEKAIEAIRTALAMGADRGIHVQDASLDSHNELFQAEALAAAVRRCSPPFDLILTGKQAIDMDCGELGPAVAEYLGWPHVGGATAFELASDGTRFTARRRIEGAEESVECPLPALLTIEKGLVEPRYPSLPNLMKAKRKPVETLAAGDLVDFTGRQRAATELVSMAGPPPRPACTFLDGDPPQIARELVRRLREEAKVI